MIDFSTLQGLAIPEGVVTQIEDASGRVIWMLKSGNKVVLQVEKITSDTYAGETTYTGEQFILLDIYPKTNGTVSVTYGGLTKTITDTSGAEKPNAQNVFFGTFNGVSDSVATPTSGELTIEGDCAGFGWGTYAQDNNFKKSMSCCCVTAIDDVGVVVDIPASAFMVTNSLGDAYKKKLKKVTLKDGVESIGEKAFANCTGIEQMTIPDSVVYIPPDVFTAYNNLNLNGDFLTINEGNPNYCFKGNCLITKTDNKMIFGFSNAVIPDGVKTIGSKACKNILAMAENFVIPEGVETIEDEAFYSSKGITDLTLPSSLTYIGLSGCYCSAVRIVVHATTPPTINGGDNNAYAFDKSEVEKITVPKGCGSAYKVAYGWKNFESVIVEAT